VRRKKEIFSSGIIIRIPNLLQMSVQFASDAEFYADNVSESQWKEDSDKFSKYGPSMDFATCGGAIQIKNLREFKIFIHGHIDTNNRLEEEDKQGKI
jgi:hypothetical protein